MVSAITCGKISVASDRETLHVSSALASAVSKFKQKAQDDPEIWTATGTTVCQASLGLG